MPELPLGDSALPAPLLPGMDEELPGTVLGLEGELPEVVPGLVVDELPEPDVP